MRLLFVVSFVGALNTPIPQRTSRSNDANVEVIE